MALKGLKVIGVIEISLEELRPVIDKYVLEKHKLTVEKIEIGKGSILATVNHDLGQAPGLERLWEPLDPEAIKKIRSGKVTDPDQAFKRKWVGLYAAVGEVIDAQRKRKRKFISFEDLRAELLEMKDANNNKLFIKDGEELPMYVLKQRLAPSQIPRQAKTQPNLKGVQNKGKGGLSLS